MLNKIQNILMLLIAILGTVAIVIWAGGTPARGAYDGHWWLLLTSEERSGYLKGDADCYHFELKRTPKFLRSTDENLEFVTNYYAANREKRSLPVLDVIRLANEQPSQRKSVEGGEFWNEPHGFYDGQWWREVGPADRLGFIEGYLACYWTESPPSRGSFSRTPAEYVRLINGWYKLDEENGMVDPKREGSKIADVLFKFTDQEQHTESKHQ